MASDSTMPCLDYGTCYDPEWCQQGGSCDAARKAAESDDMTRLSEAFDELIEELSKVGPAIVSASAAIRDMIELVMPKPNTPPFWTKGPGER